MALRILKVTLYSLLLSAQVHAQDVLNTSRFGQIKLVGAHQSVSQVVMYFFQGSSGYSHIIVDSLVGKGSLVALIDVEPYFGQLKKSSGSCYSIAGEFERLSQVIQKNLELPEMSKPLLMGEGDGASIVYLVLGEASKSFLGGISLNFCPVLSLDRPICNQVTNPSHSTLNNSSLEISPGPDFGIPWYFTSDPSCRSNALAEFQAQKPDSYMTAVERTHCDKESCALIAPFIKNAVATTMTKPSSSLPADIKDLPLIEPQALNNDAKSDFFVVILSGDGGWASIDKALADQLSSSGILVLGFDSLRYFWRSKTPDKFSTDLGRIMAHYTKLWGKQNVVFVGYSLGAEALPFGINRLASEHRALVKNAVLLNPGQRVEFEVHLKDWLNLSDSAQGFDIKNEVAHGDFQRYTCIYGADEVDSLCTELTPSMASVIKLPGSHHFDGDYATLGAKIMAAAGVTLLAK